LLIPRLNNLKHVNIYICVKKTIFLFTYNIDIVFAADGGQLIE
jgi:hypothetical protein